MFIATEKMKLKQKTENVNHRNQAGDLIQQITENIPTNLECFPLSGVAIIKNTNQPLLQKLAEKVPLPWKIAGKVNSLRQYLKYLPDSQKVFLT